MYRPAKPAPTTTASKTASTSGRRSRSFRGLGTMENFLPEIVFLFAVP
jgi:hypothetical protein